MKKTLIWIATIAAALAAQATVYRAGLKGGFINSYDGNNYTTATIPDTGVFASVEAGGVKASENTSTTYPPIWANKRTWRYHGQMYFDGGTYYFAESIDDAAWMTVDGAQILKDATWNNVGVSSAVAPAAGWHDVEIRLGNGTGGAGIPYDTTKDANGQLCGFGVARYNEEPEEKPSAMSAFVFAENTADNSWMRCIEDTSYITLNSIAKTANGYNFNLTMTAPSPANVTVYAGESAGTAESTTGWTENSGAVSFDAGETKTVEVAGTFATPPYFMVYLEGVGTTLAEGDGIKFWEWSDIKKCTMEPTVATAISSVTGTSASFAVTLGYDKVVEGMTPPAIMLKAYYGAADAGATATDWNATADFSDVSVGVNNCALSGLTEGQTYYVRFAAKTEDSDWVWSDCLAFATSGPYISAFPASLYENDGSARSFTISRPVGTDAEDLTVYLSYSASAATLLSGLPESVVLPAGELSVTVPFTVVDNETADGNVVVTITIAENAAYVRGNPASVEMSILDDDSITPVVCVWTGGAGDLKWESAANWDPRVPTSVDTAKFTSTGLSANDEIAVASEAFIKELVIETTTSFKLADGGGSLQLGGITRVDVDGNEGDHYVYVPLKIFAGTGTNCVWSISGSGVFRIFCDMTKVGDVWILKTGNAMVGMLKESQTYPGPWIVEAGQVKAAAKNSFKGTIHVGGKESAASFDVTAGQEVTASTQVHIYTNGTLSAGNLNNGRIDPFYVYEGGVANIGYYFYSKAVTMHGGTVNGGQMYNGGWTQNLTTKSSWQMAVFNAAFMFDSYNAATLDTQRGSLPVDLLITKGFTNGGSGQTLTKKGDGVVKSTANSEGLKNHVAISAGTWYIDNPGEYGLGIQDTTVAAGAKIGGTGCVGMKDIKEYATLALNDGSETKYATIAPGTIDETTGEHIYGTFTSGRESAHNKLTLGKWAHLEIGVGPKNSETKLSDVDKLKVYGNLVIGENCTLDLTSNTAALNEIAGGRYTIVEADKIEGTFATVLKPKTSWKVEYVSEEVGEGEEAEEVVKSIVLTVPGKGLRVNLR